MKKFLSIFIAVAMLMSFVGVFAGAQTAMAAGPNRAASGYEYIDSYPGPVGSLVQGDDYGFTATAGAAIPTYTMGEYIDGSADDDYDTIELRETDGATVVQTSNIAANTFRLPTDNVEKDGVYVVYEVNTVTPAEAAIGYVFIKYNMTVDQTSLNYCAANYISGYVKHGDGTGASGAAVAVLFPDGDYLVYATVDTHGQFGMTIGPNADGVYERGVYSIAVIDNYPGETQYNSQVSTADAANTVDAYIYKQLYTATFGWVLDTYVEPTILYEYAAGEQTFVLKLLDETGVPVIGQELNFTAAGFTADEISPGFYLFTGTVASGANYLKVTVTDTIGGVTVSASKTLAVTPLGVWNPQVTVDAPDSIPDYGVGPYCEVGRQVYDKLPCTVGNSLEIFTILYEPVDDVHYVVHDWSAVVSGPVTPLGDDKYLVNSSGQITVHFDAEIWEMADYACETFDEGRNACCHTFDADFNICAVSTCTVDSIEQVLNDDGTYDIKIAISGDPNNVVDCELCDKIVVHIYTIAGERCLTANDLWYNPIPTEEYPYGTNIDDLPILFDGTNMTFVRDGNTLIVKGVDLSGLCAETFVVQVFGTETLSECASAIVTHPLIYENTGDITSPYIVTSISAAADVETLVAGVCETITITAPGFSGTPDWAFSNYVAYSVVDMGDGTYEITLSPAIDDEGTFTITGTYESGCDVEEAVVEIPVILPEITVQIGLKDGSVIENDHIITEGFTELLYVTVTNPLTEEELTLEDLYVTAVLCDCDIPSSVVYGWHPAGCEGISPLAVIGLDNPNVACDPQFVFYITLCGAEIYVDTFTLVPPTIMADPTEDIPFYGCATCGEGTIVTFSVIDAHAHGAPNEGINVTDATSIYFGSAFTGPDGAVKFVFRPTYQGNFYVELGAASGYAVADITLHGYEFVAGWNSCVFNNWIVPLASGTTQILTTVYMEPVLDTEAPVVTATAGEVVEGMVTISGTVEDNVGVVSLYIGAMKVDFAPDGAFSAVVALNAGENVIKVVAFDAAENKGEVELTVEMPTVTVVKIQIGSDIMTVNGQIKQLDAVAEIKEGRTYLPLRQIGEALGAEVTWIAETKGITLVLGEHTVGLQIGNVSAVVDGNVIAIFPPYLKPYGDGTFAATMVPVRLISEGLGAEVTWDPALRIVTITLIQP